MGCHLIMLLALLCCAHSLSPAFVVGGDFVRMRLQTGGVGVREGGQVGSGDGKGMV